ncbi:MAG TPA: hypothetical protein VFJ76_06065 [Solirubrobacterales bacterium]|nr:hypothetical protein [Solirubrobacterales bacterium]
MSERIIVSRAHRDALYTELLTALGEVPDLEALSGSARPEDIERCERIARRLEEVFRLIQGGLGWGYPEGDAAVELTLPPDELRPIVECQRRLLVIGQEANQADREDTQAEWQQAEEAREACTALLEQLAEEVTPCR